MPELPEVEVIMRGILPHLLGNKVTGITFSDYKLRLPVPRKQLQRLVQGGRIKEVGRRAKYITILMDTGALLVIHLGMTGNLGLFPVGSESVKHDHLCFSMDSKMELRYNDIRRFGSIQVFGKDDAERDRFFGAMGPEPFWEEYSSVYLEEKAKGRTQPVKNFLMDNRVVVGIGNIYANEILYAAGIHPSCAIGQLNNKDWQIIVIKTRETLASAIAAGGSTISDFVNSSGEKGYFQLSLQVYGRKDKKCSSCDGLIEKINIAGRATFFCKRCQK